MICQSKFKLTDDISIKEGFPADVSRLWRGKFGILKNGGSNRSLTYTLR